MQMISEDDIRNGFNDQTIRVMTNPEELKAFLQEEKKENKVFLMMSSGSFGGLELKEIFS